MSKVWALKFWGSLHFRANLGDSLHITVFVPADHGV